METVTLFHCGWGSQRPAIFWLCFLNGAYQLVWGVALQGKKVGRLQTPPHPFGVFFLALAEFPE